MSDYDEDWSADEVRPDRDPTLDRDEKCDACKDVASFVAEVPRSRKVGAKEVEMPPARFRLCSFHGKKLLASDHTATIHAIREPASE